MEIQRFNAYEIGLLAGKRKAETPDDLHHRADAQCRQA
jgi:hypothetical protein